MSSNNVPETSTEESLTVDQRMDQKGIPRAEVLEDVESYLAQKKQTVDEATDEIKENYKKYKLVEDSFTIQKQKISESIADYKKSLTALEMLAEQKAKERESVEVTFKLDENIYTKALIENFDKVCVWLGANVMVEYEREEATQMLKTNLANIEKADRELDENLDFLRDQITTTEVNVAHLYNFGVQQKRKLQKS